jgi:YegS/Rv2252/BmrU family lipid kinase
VKTLRKKRMLLIYNPVAGLQKFPSQLGDVVDRFTEAGFLVTAYPTRAPGDISEIIAFYADEYDYITCSGGDGTISEAIEALLPLASRPIFGVIPSGTTNDYSSSLGIPKDIMRAADVITNGEAKPLDIGRFGNRHFTYVAAFGLLTEVSYSTPQASKNVLGSLAYFFEGIKRLGSVKSHRCELWLDDEAISGDYILGMVANSHSVAGIKLPIDIETKMDDGLFEVILLRMPDNFKDRQSIVSSLLRQEINPDYLTVRKAREVAFTSPKPVAWTLDGDFGGEYKDIVIENRHQAIEIMMPK